MNAKNTTKSPIHENADANITCDFGDGDISHSRSRLPHGHIVSSIIVRCCMLLYVVLCYTFLLIVTCYCVMLHLCCVTPELSSKLSSLFGGTGDDAGKKDGEKKEGEKKEEVGMLSTHYQCKYYLSCLLCSRLSNALQLILLFIFKLFVVLTAFKCTSVDFMIHFYIVFTSSDLFTLCILAHFCYLQMLSLFDKEETKKVATLIELH